MQTFESTFRDTHKLVDEADILRRAIAKLESEPNALGDDKLVLLPAGMHIGGLERRFV